MTVLRERLRAETRAAHDRLDAIWAGHDLRLRPAYIKFLTSTAAALLPLEAALAAAGVARRCPDWPQRRRGAELSADLAGLGVAGGPSVTPAPIATGPAMLGVLYVLEGSRLGGQVLARQAAISADPAVVSNQRFLAHGRGARLWPSFLKLLEEADPIDATPICQAANDTFATFEAAAQIV